MEWIAPAAIAAVLVPFAVTIVPDGPARAADCLAGPNGAAPAGSHWYYRTDRVQKRKCWYVAPQDQNVRQVARRPAPHVRPPAPSMGRATTAVSDGQLAPADGDPSPTDVWPALPLADTAQDGAVASPPTDVWQSADALAGGAAAPDAAVQDDITTGANPDAAVETPPQEAVADVDAAADATDATDATTAVALTPAQILILILCVFAVFGAALYEIIQIAARRRQDRLERWSVDRSAVMARDRMAPRSGTTRAPPPWAKGRFDRPSDDESTLRDIMRGDEQRPAWRNEPAA